MANWKLIGSITAGVLVLGGIGSACGGGNDTSTTTTPTTTAHTDRGDKTSSETRPIPNLVGMGLQSAQDRAQDAGFYNLTSHDAAGRDRMQALDRNWKVCTQTPVAGTKTSTDTKLDFGTVKLDETCPDKDQSPPAEAGATMPDFAGKSVKAARASLDSSTSITVTDASGEDRLILVESNWQVCTQDPKPGAKLTGQPVEFTAVKYGESCP